MRGLQLHIIIDDPARQPIGQMVTALSLRAISVCWRTSLHWPVVAFWRTVLM